MYSLLTLLHLGEATPWTFDNFLTSFVQLVTKITTGAWGAVLSVVLDQANFIMIIPVMVYIFVTATASLQSFYKG